jgi:hypothetical protein
MNITSQGNSTLIRWGIFPAESDNAMSNATAMVAYILLNLLCNYFRISLLTC